jgi:hypothetical protein
LAFWNILIAILAVISAMIGVFLGTYQLEIQGYPFEVHNGFEAFYLFLEIFMYFDIIITFFTDYHDEEKDVQIRDI